MSDQLAFIYALCDPDTNKVRYIGQSKNPGVRYSQHCRESGDTPKGEWIANLRSNGRLPTMRILLAAPRDEIAEYERNAIRDHAEECDLFNCHHMPIVEGVSNLDDELGAILYESLSREDRIRASLFMLRMSQAEAAREIGVEHNTVRTYLAGQTAVDRERVLSKLEDFIEGRVLGDNS